jgi:hypothetical protein
MRVPHRRLPAFAAAAVVLLLASPALAQGKPATASSDRMFVTGPFYAGPRMWLGNLNGAVAFGGQIERGFSQPGAYGPGIIAGGLGIDWYSWSQSYSVVGEYKYSVVPIQLFGNYHVVLENHPKLDPYLGLALVYSHYSSSWSGSSVIPGGASASASTTDFAGQGGLRYFVNDKFAVQGQVGFGYGTLGLGATWRF